MFDPPDNVDDVDDDIDGDPLWTRDLKAFHQRVGSLEIAFLRQADTAAAKKERLRALAIYSRARSCHLAALANGKRSWDGL